MIGADPERDQIYFPPSTCRHLLTRSVIGPLQPTSANFLAARVFLEQKWLERASELQRPSPPDLSGACKFAALFAQQVFRGKLQSNLGHDYVVCQGSVLDLTNADGMASVHPYAHDRYHHLNREHIESLASNLPRVQSWVDEFLQRYPSIR